MQKSNSLLLNNEFIASLFAVLLTLLSLYLTYNSLVENNLILSLLISNGLVLLSLNFRFFIKYAFPRFSSFTPCLNIISPFLFWLLLLYLPIIIILSFYFVSIITLYIRKSFSTRGLLSYQCIYIPLLYFIIIGSEAWNMHRTPLPGHYFITQSQTGSDLTFFSALTSMLKTYNLCSIGIDGLNEFPYHYGTYHILSKISNILNLNSLYINHLIAPLILLPTALYLILETVTIFKKYLSDCFGLVNLEFRIRDHIILASILTTLTNAPFGLPFVANLSFFTSPFQIDSQLIANFILIIFLALITDIFKNKNKLDYIGLFLIISLYFVLYFTKSTASHLAFFSLIYVFFRYLLQLSLKQNSFWFFTLLICTSITLFLSSNFEQNVVNKSGNLTFDFFSLWKHQIPLREWQWIFLSNNFYVFCSFLLLAYFCKEYPSLSVLHKLKEPKFILLELIFVLSILSVLLTSLFGGSLSFASTYYLDSMKFISLVFFSAVLSILFRNFNFQNMSFKNFLKNNSPLKFISWTSILFLLITGSGLSLKGWTRTLNKHFDSQIDEFNHSGKASLKVKLLRTLLKLSKYQNDKSHACLWIPKSNTLFWHELAQEVNEAFLPFWPVALSEMSLIDGYPLSNKLNGTFGYEVYGKDDTHSREKNLAEIKTKSAKLGFKRLIVLWDHSNYETFTLLNQ